MRTGLKQLLLQEISILEWHDGIVRAIGTHQHQEELMTIVAWDLKTGRKAYVLLNLPADVAHEMKRVTDLNESTLKAKNWSDFNRIFDEFVEHYEGIAYLALEEPSILKPLPVVPIDPEHLNRLANYNLEDVFSKSSKTFWFGIRSGNYFADLTPYNFLQIDAEPRIFNVGWLDSAHLYTTGVVPKELQTRILKLCETPVNRTRGFHVCPFCEVKEFGVVVEGVSGEKIHLGSAELRVNGQAGVIYAAPDLIYHYIVSHQYLPPDEFLKAIR